MPSKSTLKRKPGETKSEYLQGLMDNKTMLREYPRRDQRYAVANSYWRQYGPLGNLRNLRDSLSYPKGNLEFHSATNRVILGISGFP